MNKNILKFLRYLKLDVAKRKMVNHFLNTSIFLYFQAVLDAYQYKQFADFGNKKSSHIIKHLEADIIRLYHQVEKGLAMPDFRPRFGSKHILKLILCLEDWYRMNDLPLWHSTTREIGCAIDALKKYKELHDNLGVDVSDILPSSFASKFDHAVIGNAGVRPIQIVTGEDRDAFHRIIRSRSSVRHFDRERIPENTIVQRAIEAAICSPSVCNRQTCKVHIYLGEHAREILSLQNGNRGFGHQVPMVLIPTSDVRLLTGARERNQSWIDGGIFSMSLLLALHAEGLGAVSLNWCVLNQADRALHRAADIPPYERILMLIGCGYPESQAVVPISMKRHPNEIVRWHEQKSVGGNGNNAIL